MWDFWRLNLEIKAYKEVTDGKWGPKGGALIKQNYCPHKKLHQRAYSLSLSTMWGHSEDTPAAREATRNWTGLYLDLGLPSFQNCGKTYFCCLSPTICIFLLLVMASQAYYIFFSLWQIFKLVKGGPRIAMRARRRANGWLIHKLKNQTHE